jgi:signal transduction histidine kinase
LIDTIGLIPALRRLFENYSADTGIEVLAELPENMELTGNVNICVYRVAQEALRNVQRHSEADAVLIRLTDEDGLAVLKVEDDGKGFDISEQPPWVKDPNKVGLLYMRQRVEAVGGTVSVQTGPDQGCRLTVMIPSRSKEDILEKNKGHDR